MCGIIYERKLNKENVNYDIKSIYFDQKERGTNGYGFVAIKDGNLKHFRSKYEHLILHDLKENKCSDILFHHRRPTSTHNVENAAHPLCSGDNFKDHKYYMVHNGSIHNSKELYRKHTDAKLTYESICGMGEFDMPIFNDSESLMLELALIIEGTKSKNDFAAYGSMAFVMIQTDNNGKPLNLYFGRNDGSPLKIKSGKNKLTIASDIEGEDVAINSLNKISYETNESSKEIMVFPRHTSYSNYDVDDTNISSYLNKEQPGHRRQLLPMENPFQRENIMNLLPKVKDEFEFNVQDEYDDDLSKKKDGDLYLLQEGFMGDLSAIDDLMHNQHDIKELARLREEKEQINNALKKVDAEIDRRIVMNDKTPRV